MKDKNMCNIISYDTCPRCGNSEFLVYEKQEDMYYTKNSKILGSDNLSYKCQGICIKCKTIYDMLNTPSKFIPLTPLRKILFDFPKDEQETNITKNPMEK